MVRAPGRTLSQDARSMFTEVLDLALKLYGPTGLVDQVRFHSPSTAPFHRP